MILAKDREVHPVRAHRTWTSAEMTERDYGDARPGEVCQIVGNSATLPHPAANRLIPVHLDLVVPQDGFRQARDSLYQR